MKAKVEVYQSSTLVNTYTQDDNLVSLEIQRNGESGKFFGFGVSHRLNVKLSNFESEVDVSTANNLRVYIGVQLADNTVEYCGFPLFYVTEVHRDERKHIASITAYDNIKLLETATLADLHNLETPYTIAELASQIASRVSTTASGNTGT
ncbi:MAG: hypothetical protein KBS91_03975 [Firmicutes bacterium]|nr:hypothetical protein [Candidatus Caballimonas caccae]